eukprot:TRINITY_DN25859_c0_g1_i1.p1 TRINITY_DN25859_c0_g1~~TRINITY_DN25859_c0_g1_i1.p1  ORF type:complete len:322 (+),score=85.42 TRINITY_DN25859_c0_g1_i1:121-1086(+)
MISRLAGAAGLAPRRAAAKQLLLQGRRPLLRHPARTPAAAIGSVRFASEYTEAAHVIEKDPQAVVNELSGTARRQVGAIALSHHFGCDVKNVLEELDHNRDGKIDRAEFKRYLLQVVDKVSSETTPHPTSRQLFLFGLNTALPFLVFGMLDNSIMIVGGDVVDDFIGSTFALSQLACAAIANTFADVLGISIGNTVERFTSKCGLPQAELQPSQMSLPVVRRVQAASSSIGILIGCIIGMTPLLFRDEEKADIKKFFDELDRDGNGRLSVSDLKPIFEKAGLKVAEDKKAHHFDKAGKKDGDSMSFDEFYSIFMQVRKENK